VIVRNDKYKERAVALSLRAAPEAREILNCRLSGNHSILPDDDSRIAAVGRAHS
jgi:hypothetical protein